MAISLVILDRDRRYMELAADYMRRSEFGRTYRIQLFSYPESLQQFTAKEGGTDVLLVSPDALPIRTPSVGSAVCFCCTAGRSRRGIPNILC